ncbi:host specificity factor TipJ family phage tail protein [Massilia sp. DWR3-1-1]|uniref:host specificity factor TipJ family phage tail protein n=1 Tax=Massilia sp. DWR3-1-1 TaxID=2804559 RepID=UPI003CEC057B
MFDHPFAAVAPRLFEAASLAEWLLEHYGAAPQVTVQIFAGEPSAENEISHDVGAILAGDADEYVILESPGSDPFTWAVIIAAVFAVAAYVLMPKPVMPGNVNRTQQSPNNALGSRENKVRLLERVEDIYGTVKSIPSLMMPTYNKYIDNKKFEYGYYCVGRGYYDIAELCDGDTLIADIDGASAAVYAPFTSPNSDDAPQLQVGSAIIDDVLTVRRAAEVDGITLKAANQADLPSGGSVYSFYSSGLIEQSTKQPNFNSILEVGDSVDVIAHGPLPTRPNYSGTFVVTDVGDGYIYVDADWIEDALTISGRVSLTTPPASMGWVTLPDLARTQVWCNITAPNGLFKDDGGKAPCNVDFEIQIERLTAAMVPTGVVEVVTGSLTGADSDEHADTIEHSTAWAGPARVRVARTSNHDFAFKGTVQDEIKWADLYSVTPVSKTEFGNKTTIHTITKATARATAVKTRQLNCLASRRLPIYSGTTFSGAFDATGRLASGTIAATSKLVDIIAAVSLDPKIGARDLVTEVDMAQIWGVQQALDAWNPECGQFNFTFDTDNTSFEETIISIANAGFCIAYRQNGKIRLSLDRAQAASTALFTHRNKKPRAETITRKFASDADYDGVEFVYVDPDSDQSETITLPLDGSYTKLKKFEIAGIRSFEQAWLRANREYFKIRGQRINIETTTTMDARALLPNARIDIVDNTRFKSYDGEVVGQDGLVLTLSQDVRFAAGLPHSIVLMRRDGTLQSIPVTAGAEANQVVLQSLPTEAITTNYGPTGIRTIFSFAADSARGAQAYQVQELDLSDGQYVTLKAVNYSDTYFAADYAAIPAKETIIN